MYIYICIYIYIYIYIYVYIYMYIYKYRAVYFAGRSLSRRLAPPRVAIGSETGSIGRCWSTGLMAAIYMYMYVGVYI